MDELLNLRPMDRVRVLHDDGTEADYVVKFEPWTLGHGEWVIGLKGMAGGYKLSRVVKVLERAGVVLCVLCRRPNPNPACSACPTCIPPDEGETRAQWRAAALEAEVQTLQAACEEHIRIRNEQGECIEGMRQEVASVLVLMDGLAATWGDEGVFRRCRDRLRTIAEVN